MASKQKATPKRSAKKSRALSRAEELVDFIQDVALGKREATEAEVEEACAELKQYLPDLPEK